MPPKKIQPKVQPKKEEPKPQEKKGGDKNAKNVKQQPKKDQKGSIERQTKESKLPQKKDGKAADKKEEKKDEKKGGKKEQNVKDNKLPQKNDNKKDSKPPDNSKDPKGLEKKDANNKSISKLEKPKEQQKGKKDVKDVIVSSNTNTNKHLDQRKVLGSNPKEKLQKDRSLSKAIINRMDEPKVVIERTKGEDYLIKQTGLLEAYELFLRSICKYGLPTGDIYEFAAQQIQKYERKKKAKQLKIKAEMQIRKAALKKIAKQDQL